jgi:hypothetical protein
VAGCFGAPRPGAAVEGAVDDVQDHLQELARHSDSWSIDHVCVKPKALSTPMDRV